MDKLKFIREKAQWLVGQIVVDGDDLDLHIIEAVLEEVFEAGVEEEKEQRGQSDV